VVTKYSTIKAFATAKLLETDYVDCWGRNVGLDYDTILKQIKEEFPKARTSMRALRLILYSIDGNVRLPVRRRSRRILAKEYARALLLQRDSNGSGVTFLKISNAVKRKFPDVPKLSVHRLTFIALHMSRAKFKVPANRV
jgi:hypothetical protein